MGKWSQIEVIVMYKDLIIACMNDACANDQLESQTVSKEIKCQLFSGMMLECAVKPNVDDILIIRYNGMAKVVAISGNVLTVEWNDPGIAGRKIENYQYEVKQ